MERLIFGRHALEQMRKRGITRDEALRVVHDPEVTYDDVSRSTGNPIVVYQREGLAVAVEPRRGRREPTIITVMKRPAK